VSEEAVDGPRQFVRGRINHQLFSRGNELEKEPQDETAEEQAKILYLLELLPGELLFQRPITVVMILWMAAESWADRL